MSDVNFNSTDNKAAPAGGALPITTRDASGGNDTYTILSTDSIVIGDVGSSMNTVALTLPAASGLAGKELIICRAGDGMGSLTLDTNGSETLSGSTSQISTTTEGDAVRVVCDGTGWHYAGIKGFGI